MKKGFSWLFILLIILSTPVIAESDYYVNTDPIQNTYSGKLEARTIATNIGYKDVSSKHWAKESISRMGSLELIKGYINGNYGPDDTVSKEMALTVLLRAVGQEDAAIAAGNALVTPGVPQSASTLWSQGYLTIASQQGLITAADLNDGLTTDLTTLDPNVNFIRTSGVTREKMAEWIVKSINATQPTLIAPVTSMQKIFNYSDWTSIDQLETPFVEAVTAKKIMQGTGTSFNPKGFLKRSELAQIVKNMDTILYTTMGLERKLGVVGKLNDSFDNSTSTPKNMRQILIRNDAGKIDAIEYELTSQPNDLTFLKDAVVYKGGSVGGLGLLKVGDAIEYIVDPTTKEVIYIYDKGISQVNKLLGTIKPQTDLTKGTITIVDLKGQEKIYKLIDGLYEIEGNLLRIKDYNLAKDLEMPINTIDTSQILEFTLNDNELVTYIASTKAINDLEIKGIVKENNPLYGYISILDYEGKTVTKKYNPDTLKVEKQNYYDTENHLSYIDEIYPSFSYNGTVSNSDDIEAGDMIVVSLDPSDKSYILKAQAKTNLVMKIGTIKSFINDGDKGGTIMIELEDGSVTSFPLTGNEIIKLDGLVVNKSQLGPGSIVRLLINQGILAPGQISEVVKQIDIDPYGNVVTQILKGYLVNVNATQQRLTLGNVYTLEQTGWTNFRGTELLDFSNKKVTYYYKDKPITLDYAMNSLVSPDITAYIAMEKYYDKEKTIKVVFREDRDSALAFDNVLYSNQNGTFKTVNATNNYTIDDGSIVVRNGKLVENQNIFAPDYVQVILNGKDKAAIVNITPEPNNDQLTVFRGRIKAIEDMKNFEIQSNSILKEMKWIFSPVERIYEMDYSTQIIDEDGPVPMNEFIDYSDISKSDQVYTIISRGSKADYVVQMPYTTEGVIGTVYATETGKISIKDVLVYEPATGKWVSLSLTNSYATILLEKNSLIFDLNQVIGETELKIGDKIRVMSTENIISKLKLEESREIKGYLVFVEK